MRSGPWTWALRGALAALAVLLVWTAVVLLTVRDDLQRAQQALERARAADGVDDVRAPLAVAERELASSVGRLRQPGPALVAAVPLAGRSVAAVRRTAEAALAVTRGTGAVLAAVPASGLVEDGRVDLAVLQEVRTALERAAERARGPVADLRRQPLGLVPGLVAGPAEEASRELQDVPADLAQAAAGLAALHDVLGGDGARRVAVMLQNNAELRGTGGLVTVFAQARAVDGRLQVDAFQDVEDVADVFSEARRVPAPEDFRRLYGPYLADTTLWKNTNMSPDVPTSSQVMARVVEATTGTRPDVLLWVDVPAIAAVLRATGPARLPDGSELRAEDAVRVLLSEAYADAVDTAAGQAERRAVLRAAADAVLGRLLGGPGDAASPTALARELAAAAAGRHLALWSADPQVQADLERAGLAGEVTAGSGDLSALTVHNLGGGDRDGNKLDYYGRRQTTVRAVVGRDAAVVEQELAIRNTAPARGLPVYVAGRVTPGVQNSFVSLAVPADAEDLVVERDGTPLDVTAQPAGDHAVVTDVVSVPPGRTVVWRLRYRVPVQDGRYALRLHPQPLAVDAGLALEVRAADGLDLADGPVQVSGPYDEVVDLRVQAQRPGWATRLVRAVREFWTEPVRLP